MKQYMQPCTTRVNIIFKSYGIVRDRSKVLHPTLGLISECHTIRLLFTRVHTRIHAIAIIPVWYKSYIMVRYGQTWSSTGIHGLTPSHGFVRSYTAFMSVSYCLILSSVASAIVIIIIIRSFFDENLKIYEAKPLKWLDLYITWTNVDRTVRNPCECRVNRA